MREIKISKCNKALLSNLTKQMYTVDKFLTLRIDSDETSALGYFPSHDVVKVYGVSNEKFFEGIDAHDKPIRVSLQNGLDILQVLKNYPGDTVDIILNVYDDNPEAEELYTAKIVFRYETDDDNMEVELVCAEKSFSDKVVDPLSQQVLTRLFDTTNRTCSFEISTDRMSRIKSFSDIDKTNRAFGYTVNQSGDVFIVEKRLYDDSADENNIYKVFLAKYAGEVSETHTYMCNKNIFGTMRDNNWNVDICASDSKVIYKYASEESGEKISIIGVINDTL